jgi:wyosine [tRNA(Phe)-imidazoG37] synthetase (radical SAM superfamily)
MADLLALHHRIIYGPVNSRRLGRSLGINLSPTKEKYCPFDCVYCQYGRTKLHSIHSAEYSRLFPEVPAVAAAVATALANGDKPDYVTFSGNGEATAHPDFPAIVEEIKPIVRQLAPQAKLAILSNSCMVTRPDVASALNKLDVRIMKLDAGNPAMFAQVNRPAAGISFGDVVNGLAQLNDVTIQTLFMQGRINNSSVAEVADWLSCLKRIKPLGGQIYTCVRGHAEPHLEKVSADRLAEIAATATRELGVPIEAY